MNRFIFGIKNVFDKLIKMVRDPNLIGFYTNVYLLSKFRKINPDVYIISYPKCGRTWTRITLKKYLEMSGDNIEFKKDPSIIKLLNETVVKFEPNVASWIPAPRRIDQLKINEAKYEGKKICFIARDPRDVMISSFYHLKYREKIYSKNLSEFIRDELVGIKKVVAYMNLWAEYSDAPESFYITTYEELREEPGKSFRTLLEFIGIEVDPKLLDKTLHETSFEKMKKMEADENLSEPWMKPGDKKTDKSMKIRKGKIGGYKEELPPEDISFLNKIIEDSLTTKLPYGGKKE